MNDRPDELRRRPLRSLRIGTKLRRTLINLGFKLSVTSSMPTSMLSKKNSAGSWLTHSTSCLIDMTRIPMRCLKAWAGH